MQQLSPRTSRFDILLTMSNRPPWNNLKGPISLKEPAMKASSPCLARFFIALLLLTTSVWCVAQTYSITDLGTVGGSSSGAKAVNASGQVTGYSSASGNAGTDVFRYSAGHMSNLGTLGGNVAIGNAINVSGQIAGYSTNNVTYRAFITNGNQLTDIGDLGGG